MNFTELTIKAEYRSPRDNVVEQFFLPALECSISYKRSVGFFSSTALIKISKGITPLVKNGGKIELVASPYLSEEDKEAIRRGYDNRLKIIEKTLLKNLTEPDNTPFASERLNLLACLIENGVLDIKIAFTDDGNSVGMYHEKLGLLEDKEGNKIAFSGSMNESGVAMNQNYEIIDVFCDWKSEGEQARVVQKEEAFARIWGNCDSKLKVISFPAINKAILDKYKRGKPDYDIDRKEFSSFVDYSHDNDDEITFVCQTPPISEIQEKDTPIYLEGKITYTQEQYTYTKINEPIFPKSINLYDYQLEAISTWKENNFCGIFDMATGTGKTLTGLGAIIKCANDCNNNLAVIIVAPYQHLVEQWTEDIERCNIKPLVAYSTSVQKDWKDRLKRAIRDQNLQLNDRKFFLLITTNSTFKSNFIQEQIGRIKGNILLVIDEAHNAGSINFKKYLDSRFKFRLALSATLDRHNDMDGTNFLYEYFGKVCIHYDLERAIKEKKLTPYKYYPILVYLTDSELERYKQISNEILQHIRKNKDGRIELDSYGEILAIKRSRIIAGAQNKLNIFREQVRPYKEKANILVYCGATQVFSDLNFEEQDFDKTEIGERQIISITKILGNEMNMSVSRFTSEENIEIRKSITQKFKDKELQAIVAIKCLDEGVNIPSIKTAFILASTTNPKEYIQRRGRVLRISDDKAYAEIYDFVTLPRELNTVLNFTEDEVKGDLALVKNELKRVKEFSRISLNRIDSLDIIDKIQSIYQITDKNLYESTF